MRLQGPGASSSETCNAKNKHTDQKEIPRLSLSRCSRCVRNQRKCTLSTADASALLETAGLRIEELLFNILVDSCQPFLSALRAIVEVVGIRLELSDALLGGAQLQRQLMRKLHGAITIAVRGLGCLLQQLDDRLSRAIEGVARLLHVRTKCLGWCERN